MITRFPSSVNTEHTGNMPCFRAYSCYRHISVYGGNYHGKISHPLYRSQKYPSYGNTPGIVCRQSGFRRTASGGNPEPVDPANEKNFQTFRLIYGNRFGGNCPMAIVIYARKSVERENSISCETQLEYCRAMLKPDERSEDVISIVDNGYSGGNMNRDGFQRMMKLISQGDVR